MQSLIGENESITQLTKDKSALNKAPLVFLLNFACTAFSQPHLKIHYDK